MRSEIIGSLKLRRTILEILSFQDELLIKAREFAQAREAQAKLKAEIETYRELLNAERNRSVRP